MTDRAIRDMLESEAERFEQEKDTPKRQYVRPGPARAPSQVYSIRIPVEELETLRKVAAARHMPPSVLMRDWILERLSYEATPRATRLLMPDPSLGSMDSFRVNPGSAYIVMNSEMEPKKIKEALGAVRAGVEMAG